MKQEIIDKLQEVANMCEKEGYAIAASITDGEATQNAIRGNILAVGHLAYHIAGAVEEGAKDTPIKELALMYALQQVDAETVTDTLKTVLDELTAEDAE